MMDEGLADARAQLERLYYDTAFAANPTVFGALRALAPLEHVLLGTDFPFGQEIGVQVNLAGLERVAGAEDRRAIEGVNAQALFPRLARSSDAAAAGG
jgi:predicted TIM-barrel fold metal-dependent hydrolase